MADRTVKAILKADVTQFVAGMRQAEASAKTFTKNATNSATKNSAAWTTVGTGMMAAGAAITGVGIAAAKTGIAYNTLQQTSRAALKTLLGSAQAANAQMDKLDAFARTSPFAKQVFITAQQQLIGFGMAAKDVIPTLDAIQNAVAAVGGSNDDIAQLTRIIAQVGATGKITAEDLNEFGQRGVDAATLIGSQMGKTGAQIREEITKGTLGADDAVKALVAGMDQRFAGSAANVKATFAGATDRVKAAWRDLSGELMAPMVGPNGGGFLIDVANGAANAMRAFESLPTPIKTTSETVTLLVGGTALLAGGLLVLAPRIAATKLALADMGRTGALLSGGLSKAGSASKMLGGPLVIATVALGYFAQQAQESKARVDEMAASLDAQTGAVTDNTRAWVNKNLSDSGALAEANRLGISVGDVTDAVLGNSAALVRVTAAVNAYDESLPNNRKGMLQSATTHHLLSNAISGGNDELNKGIEKTKLLAEANDAGGAAAGGAVAPVDVLATAQTDLATETQKAKDAIDAEVQALQDSGLMVLSTRAATRDFAQAQRDATAALKENGKSLADGTVKGDANRAALDKVASSALGLADSIYKQTGSEDKMRGSLIKSRAALVETAMKFGMTKAQANAYADSIIKIPAHKTTQVELDSAVAKAKAKELQAQINAIVQGKVPGLSVDNAAGKAKIAALQKQIDALHGKKIAINVNTHSYSTGPGGSGGPVAGIAAGGYIRGPGTTTSDSIPSLLSDKEYVVKAKAVDYYGVGTMDAINSMRFAAGGYVGQRSTVSAAGPSLVGVAIEGTLDMGNGLIGVMRGVVKSEMAESGAKLRYAGVS
jgi:tape measure domain-containing protein